MISISNDTTILAGDRIQLHATGADSYEWTPEEWLDDPASAKPWTKPQSPMTYTVTGTSHGCSGSAQVHIDIMERMFIPSAFSPNNDGINDVFNIQNFSYQKLMDFSIYGRWGQRVFFSFNGMSGWDGTFKGEPADIGTYYYFIRLASNDGKVQTIKGEVILLR
jgi:gliding motility-associated-like protein